MVIRSNPVEQMVSLGVVVMCLCFSWSQPCKCGISCYLQVASVSC